MAKPQQTELARSGLGATADTLAPVPEDNLPGHHPEHEQDKPVERYVARARELAGGDTDAEAVSDAEAATDFEAGARGPGAQPAPARTNPLAAVVVATVPAVAFVDAFRRPDSAWDEIGERKLTWLAAISLLPGVGSWAYALRVRRRLEAQPRM